MECRYVCVTEIGVKTEIVGDYSGVKNLLFKSCLVSLQATKIILSCMAVITRLLTE